MLGGQSTVTSYQYDDANRIYRANDIYYVYDNNGNLTYDGAYSYSYDAANCLTQRVKWTSGSVPVFYRYNGLNDRLQETMNGNTTTFTMDYNMGLTQALSDGTNTYIYGNGRIAQTDGATTDYYITDALGSVRQLTDASGAITYARAYDPYGVVTATSGASTTPYGYTGEYTSNDLVYLRARHYDPAMGRFLTRDTWSGDANSPMSFNAWNYVSGNPVNRLDPTGMCWITVNGTQVWIPDGAAPCSNTSSSFFIGRDIILPEVYKSGISVYPGTSQAQFIDNNDPYARLYNWPDFKGCLDASGNRVDPSLCLKHYGLCGQGSTAVILSTLLGRYSLNRVVNDFVFESQREPYQSERIGEPWPDYTGALELAKFINLHYSHIMTADETKLHVWDWTGSKNNTSRNPWAIDSMPSLISEWLSQGKFAIVGVKINGSSGKLNQGSASHWVTITGISRQFDFSRPESNMNWIRIYNSFNHNEETHKWVDFRKAWLADRVPVVVITPK